MMIDPLLLNVISSIQDDDEEETSMPYQYNYIEASNGIQIWKNALLKGRLPTDDEFLAYYWPNQPLYKHIYDSMVSLQLPRLTMKHPEIIPLVMRSIIRSSIDYSNKIQNQQQSNEIEMMMMTMRTMMNITMMIYYIFNSTTTTSKTTSTAKTTMTTMPMTAMIVLQMMLHKVS